MEFWKITNDDCHRFEPYEAGVYFPFLRGIKVRKDGMDAGNFYHVRILASGRRYYWHTCIIDIFERDGKHFVDFMGYEDHNRFYHADKYLKKYKYEIMCIANAILYDNALPYNGTRPCEA